MHDEYEMQATGDHKADALAAVILIAVFVGTCLFWISGH